MPNRLTLKQRFLSKKENRNKKFNHELIMERVKKYIKKAIFLRNLKYIYL